MFNFTSAAITSASVFEDGCYNAQNTIDAVYNETVKPFLIDCVDSCGFPPLQEAIDFFRSDDGKQLVRNVITGVKVFVLIVAFLSIAVVMGLSYFFANLWELYQAREEIKAAVVTTAVRTKREAKVFVWMAKREVRRQQREAIKASIQAAKRVVSALDNAAGVTAPTFK